MKRHLVFLSVFLTLLFALPAIGIAQEAPRLGDPSRSNIDFLATDALRADVLLTKDEQRDMLAARFLIATCTSEGACPTFSAFIKNVPDSNIELVDERLMPKRTWTGTSATNWRAFLRGAGIPDPQNTVALNQVVVAISEGRDYPFAAIVGSLTSDPHPSLVIVFNRTAYTRELVKNLPLASLRGEDFLDEWIDIVKNPRWKEEGISCKGRRGPAEQTCEKRERARIELLWRLTLLSGVDRIAKLVLYGHHDDQMAWPGPQLERYHYCSNTQFSEELRVRAMMGDMSPDALSAELIARGTAAEVARKWTEEARRGVPMNQARKTTLFRNLVGRGASEEEALERATAEVMNGALRNITPEAIRNPDIQMCASFLWDVENISRSTAMQTWATLSKNMRNPRSIDLDGMEGYLIHANQKNALRNWMRNSMYNWYEKRVGIKASFYNEFWKEHD